MNQVMIIAAGDIGSALANQWFTNHHVTVVSRTKPMCQYHEYIPLDIDDPTCLEAIANAVVAKKIDCVVNTMGVLHREHHTPEKTLANLDDAWFMENMRVNCLFTLKLLSRLTAVLPKDSSLRFIAFSARVGSISDNQWGGWVSYRTSKAALNMVIKTTAIEWARRFPNAVVIGYHPGTVDTRLSKPFSSHAPELFSPAKAALDLNALIAHLTPSMSGNVYDWAQNRVPF